MAEFKRIVLSRSGLRLARLLISALRKLLWQKTATCVTTKADVKLCPGI